MATDWAAERLSAYEDFKADGYAVTVQVPGSEGVWSDALMASTGATADTDYTTYGISGNFSIREIDGTIVQQNDVKLDFAAMGLNAAGALVVLPDLTTEHQVVIGSDVYRIINPGAVKPGNVTLMYRGQLRKV